MIIKYQVNDQNYNIVIKKKISNSLLQDLKKLNSDKKILFVFDRKIDHTLTDNLIKNLKTSGCSVFVLELTGDKINKSEKTLFKIIDFLIVNNFTKNSIILSCAGGVIGDIASLAACIYLRGMIYLHIPTTMTSIIDSCIGGKTGINYKDLINSIGTYYHPKSVYISKEILDKIPNREYYSGIPEIIKYGIIKKNSILKSIIENQKLVNERNFKFISKLISESLKTKIFYFSNDIYEKNSRLALNFGHTFAHAIEMATQKLFKKEVFRHGEAVGLGILCELYYANRGYSKLQKDVEIILSKYDLPTRVLKNRDKQDLHSEIYKFLFVDKKKIGKYPRYIQLKSIGKPKIKILDDFNLINRTINNILE